MKYAVSTPVGTAAVLWVGAGHALDGRLKTGDWRLLSAGEVAALRRATGLDEG